jgi:hypothetical protein
MVFENSLVLTHKVAEKNLNLLAARTLSRRAFGGINTIVLFEIYKYSRYRNRYAPPPTEPLLVDVRLLQ